MMELGSNTHSTGNYSSASARNPSSDNTSLMMLNNAPVSEAQVKAAAEAAARKLRNMTVDEQFQALLNIVRYGPYESFRRVFLWLTTKPNEEENDNDRATSTVSSSVGAAAKTNTSSSPLFNGCTGSRPVQLYQVLSRYDEEGHTLAHWATKRAPDIRFLYLLANMSEKSRRNIVFSDDEDDNYEDDEDTMSDDMKLQRRLYLHMPSQESVGMYPIHWAATEGCIPMIHLFLEFVRPLNKVIRPSNNNNIESLNGHRPVSSHRKSATNVSDGSDVIDMQDIVVDDFDEDNNKKKSNYGNEDNSSVFEDVDFAEDNTNDHYYQQKTVSTFRHRKTTKHTSNHNILVLDALDHSGCTSLLIAAQYGHANMVAFLIKRGASTNILDYNGDSALHWACYKGNVSVVGLLCHLLSTSSTNTSDASSSLSSLFVDSSNSNRSHQKRNKLPDNTTGRMALDEPDTFGHTPLHLASLRGNFDVVEYLLEEVECTSMNDDHLLEETTNITETLSSSTSLPGVSTSTSSSTTSPTPSRRPTFRRGTLLRRGNSSSSSLLNRIRTTIFSVVGRNHFSSPTTPISPQEGEGLLLGGVVSPSSSGSANSLNNMIVSSASSPPMLAVRRMLEMKDREGRTPLDLAIQYKRHGCQIILEDWQRRYSTTSSGSSTTMDMLTMEDIRTNRNIHPACQYFFNMTKHAILRSLQRGCCQFCSIQNWKMWMGLIQIGQATTAGTASGGSNVPAEEATAYQQRYLRWPFGLVLISMGLAFIMYPLRFLPIFTTTSRETDLLVLTGSYDVFLHLFTLGNMIAMLISFLFTWRTNPGTLYSPREWNKLYQQQSRRNVRRSSPSAAELQQRKMMELSRRLHVQYDDALEQLANSSSFCTTNDSFSSNGSANGTIAEERQEQQPSQPLCHTCHIVKPLRSKHCRVQRKCILLFDHYCPFVGTTIGAYNYKYFYIFLATASGSEIGFISTWIQYLIRAKQFDTFVFVSGLYLAIFLVPSMGMFLYHTDLMMKNLTTNEHQNLWRYSYLHQPMNNNNNNIDPTAATTTDANPSGSRSAALAIPGSSQRSDGTATNSNSHDIETGNSNSTNTHPQVNHSTSPTLRRRRKVPMARYYNPFDGGWFHNVYDRLFPTSMSYELPVSSSSTRRRT